MVGYNDVEYTTNGGLQWDPGQSGNWTSTFYDAHFTGKNKGWAVGSSGKVIFTDNGGESWTTQQSGFTNVYLYDVFFLNENNGWAVGGSGKIIHTSNGGTTWSSQVSGTTKDLSGVHFVTLLEGWAVGNDGKILHTIDGGSKWTEEYSRTTNHLNKVYFQNRRQGWAVGDNGTILKYEGGIRYWADVNDDGRVNVVDIQRVAGRWGYKNGDRGWDSLCDVNGLGAGDGKIDIVDIQLVAGRYGWPDLDDGLFKPEKKEGLIVQWVHAMNDSAGNPILELRVENAMELSGFEFRFTLQPAAARLIRAEIGDLWDQSGKTVMALGPKETDPGKFLFGGVTFGQGSNAKDSGVIARITVEKTESDAPELTVSELILLNGEAEPLLFKFPTGLDQKIIKTPDRFSMSQNYPNPFNSGTVIRYTLPHAGSVVLAVYNLDGKLVDRLVETVQNAGEHTVRWNGEDLGKKPVSTGIYLYHLRFGGLALKGKMMLLR
jgi:photosystem II stability/assembly factor-like uncharacterized protein